MIVMRTYLTEKCKPVTTISCRQIVLLILVFRCNL